MVAKKAPEKTTENLMDAGKAMDTGKAMEKDALKDQYATI